MPGSVVDASALAAVLFAEPDAEVVVERLKAPLLAPTLLRFEVANVGRNKIRRHPDRSEQILESLGLLPSLGIQEVSVPADEATRAARDHDLTAYDASYLWLARYLDLDLVTLDARLDSVARKSPS